MLQANNLPSAFSFHPNADGQKAMADAASAVIEPSGPPIIAMPGQIIQQIVNVLSGISVFGIRIRWPGSDVQLSLVSPSGKVYDRTTTAPGIVHQLSDNAESFSITDPEPGPWTVKLYGAQVASAGEPVRLSSNQIPASALGPVAVIDAFTDRGVKPKSIHFDASQSQAFGSAIKTFQWDFGDRTPGATGPVVDPTFLAGGNYAVTVTVTDANGASNTAHQRVVITDKDQPPTSAFRWTADPAVPLGMLFDAQHTGDVDGTIVDRSWDFGDGHKASGALAAHTFASPGTYPVTLTVTDDGGLKSVTTNLVSATGTALPTPTSSPSVSVLPKSISRTPALSVTGAPIEPLAIWGLVLLVSGTILVLHARVRLKSRSRSL